MKSGLRLPVFAIACSLLGHAVAGDPVVVVSESTGHSQVQSMRPVLSTYRIENRSTKPMVLIPQSSSTVSPQRECGISDFTKAPVLPGKSGTITVRCDWRSYGEAKTYRHSTLYFEAMPFGLRSLSVDADVFDASKSIVASDVCEVRKRLNCGSGPKRVRRLCYYGEDVYDLPISGLHLAELCPTAYFERREVGGTREIREDLDRILETTCDRIEAFTILDHGNAGLQTLSNEKKKNEYGREYINAGNVKDLFQSGKYECMLTDRPRLIFGGCSVGKGCEGRLFMAAAAKAFAPTKPVEVTAADDTAIAGVSRITSRTGSQNGRDVVLEKHGSEEKWSYRGLRGGPATAIGSVCGQEFLGTYNARRSDVEVLRRDGCFTESDRYFLEAFDHLGPVVAKVRGLSRSANSEEVNAAFANDAWIDTQSSWDRVNGAMSFLYSVRRDCPAYKTK